MNIGIDIRCLTNLNRTGVGEYTFGLASALFEIDKENQYFLFYNSFKDVSKFVPKWKQENVHYVEVRWPNKLFHFCTKVFGFPKLDKLIEKQCNPPIRRAGNETIKQLDSFFSPNIHFTTVSRNVKQILTIHDLSFEHFPDCYSLKRRLWHKIVNPKKQCKRADLVLVPSNATRKDVVETYGISGDKVKAVYPGISDIRYQISDIRNTIKEKYNLPEKFILFLGTIEPRKNILGIIEAYKKSSLIINHYSLIIAGPKGWKSSAIMDAIEKTDGVEYIGYVDTEDKQALYSLADLFVYPSLYEGFGFPVLEAMSTGTPVITSNRSSLPEIAGGAAYLVNPMNVHEIASGMEIILKDEGLREILIKRGLERIENFIWKKSALKFINLI